MWFRSKQMSRPADRRALAVAGAGGLGRAIARLNIEHFRRLLAEKKDDDKRRIIRRLLAEEEARLAAFEQPSGPQDKQH